MFLNIFMIILPSAEPQVTDNPDDNQEGEDLQQQRYGAGFARTSKP